MTEAEAWKRQAESDFTAAKSVFVHGDPSTYCQAIAKYQQVVEKSINFMDAILREHGVWDVRVRAEHYPERMINRLTRIPRSNYKEIADQLIRILGRWNPDIYDLSLLAPKLPPKGEPYQRNTEYPFQSQTGSWTAPAEETSFTREQVTRFERVATQLRAGAEQIAVMARLGTP